MPEPLKVYGEFMKIKDNNKVLSNMKRRQRNMILLFAFVCTSATALTVVAIGTIAIKLRGL